MNDINSEILQMKIQGHCLEYPLNLELEDLTIHAKQICDDLTDYGNFLLDQNDNKYTLFFATRCTLSLIIEYLERPIQDDAVYEDFIATICLHFQCEIRQYALTIKDLDILFETFEILGLLFRILGAPMSKENLKILRNDFTTFNF